MDLSKVEKKFSNRKVIVTGGAGFIGSHLCEALVAVGAKVKVIDDLSRGKLLNLKNIKHKIIFVKGDLRNHNFCNDEIKSCDFVFNLAAISTGIVSKLNDSDKTFVENVLLLKNPVEAANYNKVAHFVQISTASIYSEEVLKNSVYVKESDDYGLPEKSKFLYGLAKKIGEMYAIKSGFNNKIHITIGRLNNVYGIRDYLDQDGHFISNMVKKFVDSTGSVEVYGSGMQKRSFLHISDAVNSLLYLPVVGKTMEIYNVDSHDEYSINDVVYMIKRCFSKKKIKIKFNKKYPEGPSRRILNNRKITGLGWKPIKKLDSSLEEIIEYIKVKR